MQGMQGGPSPQRLLGILIFYGMINDLYRVWKVSFKTRLLIATRKTPRISHSAFADVSASVDAGPSHCRGHEEHTRQENTTV